MCVFGLTLNLVLCMRCCALTAANIFSIYTESIERSPAMMYQAVNIAVLVVTFLYLSIGLAGYVLFGRDVEGNVLANLDIRDPVSAAAQGCIGLAIVLTFPLNIYPARFTLHTMFVDDDTPVSTIHTVGFTLVLVFGALAVAIFIPSISELFSFLGATTGSLIAFILPSIFYLKLIPTDGDTKTHRRLCVMLAAGGVLLAIVSTYRSLQLFAEDPEEGKIE
jgi:amino acid permease